jgi:hypothetical protein
MRAELVSIATSAEPLDGLFYISEDGKIAAAALLFHGNCGNFTPGRRAFCLMPWFPVVSPALLQPART